ncbi:MAG: exostosin family protein [Candidatus Accumulibacter propinquus]|jgi:glycosyltransferase involved in cell wall biosynthesis|uniref:exostosin domain-containing protein n=1 Tax=Candidatus Accumulibacter propinquus TaxID=2954380 RepID=UPI002FC393B8
MIEQVKPIKIAIVTPSFNSVDTITRTIHSVISQAGDFILQYHVQDGGSVDGTLNVLKRWEDLINRQVLPISCRSLEFSWDSCHDNGMYDAIGKGFRRCKVGRSDWLGWINADDVLLPTAFALLSKIDSDASLSALVDWVTGAAAICRDGCQEVMTDRVLCSDVIARGLADGKHWGFVQQEGTFFREHAWQSAGGDNCFHGMKYAGDWNLWRLLAQHHQIYQFKFPTGMFSSRKGQLSQIARNSYEAEAFLAVPLQMRSTYLRELSGKNIDAFYLVPELKSGSVRIERKPIHNHLSHRLEIMSGSIVSNEGVLLVSDLDKTLSTNARKPVLEARPTTIPRRDGNFVFYDSEWQFPAITEQHAFVKARELLPTVSGTVLFAFPWATLIDLMNGKKEDAKRLRKVLNDIGTLLQPGERVVTVCQHILMLNYQNMFSELGITDVFWTHAIKGQESFPKHPRISIHPFPLYPVQAVDEQVESGGTRSLLYSFIGAKANKWYLTQSRSHILEYLGTDKRGAVIGRDTWHYNKAVYDYQINKIAIPSHDLVDKNTTQEFKKLLKSSLFSLCPSGSGPNSIRLWESIGMGAIPVILADSYLPPGDPALWDEAVVFCLETPEAIKALPARLEEMANDDALLARKRHAMRQIWMLYGPECFIYDIQKLFVELASMDLTSPPVRQEVSFSPLIEQAEYITPADSSQPEKLTMFLLGCCTRAMADPNGFRKQYFNNPAFFGAFNLAMGVCDARHVKTMTSVLRLKRVDLSNKGAV